MKTVLGYSLALVTAASTAAFVGGPAHAAGSTACPARVVVPDVRITHRQTRVYATLSQTCAARLASWSIHNASGRNATVAFSPAIPDARNPLDFAGTHRLGRHDLRPIAATNSRNERVSQAGSRFWVRLGSGTTIRATRRGVFVTVRGEVTRYDPTPGRWVPWRGAVVKVEGRMSTGAPWLPVSLPARAGRDGAVSRTVAVLGVRQYRLVTVSTSTTLGSTSAYLRP